MISQPYHIIPVTIVDGINDQTTERIRPRAQTLHHLLVTDLPCRATPPQFLRGDRTGSSLRLHALTNSLHAPNVDTLMRSNTLIIPAITN